MLFLLFYHTHTHTHGLNSSSLGPAPTLSPYGSSQMEVPRSADMSKKHAKHRQPRGSVYLHRRFDLRLNYQRRISTDQLNGRHRHTITQQTALKLQSLPVILT